MTKSLARIGLLLLAALPLAGAEDAPPTPPLTLLKPAPVMQALVTPAKREGKKQPAPLASRKAGVATWSEGGESGTASVADHSSPAYQLLQSDRVGEGNFAFHLAGGSRDWFSLTQTITPQADSKLYFLLQVRWASSDQVARVQVSTNGGSTWIATLFSRAGTGDQGDGSFLLEEVSLAAYAGQDILIRFYYDFSSGTYFPQTSNDVGMFVDDIQIGTTYQKQLYSIGDPTDEEQLYLEYINRARADAAVEAARLMAESDPTVTSAYASSGIVTSNIAAQFSHHVSSGCMANDAQPLAFNAKLLRMSRLHSQDMFNNTFQGHVSSANPPAPYQPGDTIGVRASRIGYGYTALGENVYANGKSVRHGHAGFDVDWGNTVNAARPCYHVPFNGQGMQNPPGHRLSIHNDTYKEIGVGVVIGSQGSVGPQIVTQNFGSSGGTFLTGVVFDDANNNQFCDMGEGVGGVRIEVDGASYAAVSSNSGGYTVPVDGDGNWTVRFSGGGWASWESTVAVSGGRNRKVDYIVQPGGSPYDTWAAGNGVLGGPFGDHDLDGVLNVFEYAAANLDAKVSDAGNLPAAVPGSGGVTMTLAKNTGASGITISAETSQDLENWSPSGFTVLADTPQTYRVYLPANLSAGFVRFVVRLGP